VGRLIDIAQRAHVYTSVDWAVDHSDILLAFSVFLQHQSLLLSFFPTRDKKLYVLDFDHLSTILHHSEI